MRRSLLLVLLIAVATMGCNRCTPDAGHEVVLVGKPWFFGHGGADKDPVTRQHPRAKHRR